MRECLLLQEILSVITSQNMPCWYYGKQELRDTPSIRDGVSLETERRYRKEGARFIMTCGTQMGLGHNTMATGVVYFHRFYMFHSFKNFPRYVTACCCLLLAGKVEETPKKCRDIIRTARGLLSDNYFYSFGEDPKEEVMTLERILLQTIKFDLQVEHPYSFLLKYAKCFKGDQAKLQKMVQMAWNFVNDSLSTVVCLQWEPEIIAVALIHLASKLSKFAVNDWEGKQPQHGRWWDMFVSDVTMEIIEDICHQVLDLYQSNQKETDTNSPPQKPPSRADSPTRQRHATRSTPSSPSTKSKHPATLTNSAACSSTAASSSNSMGQINNIQSVKSLGSNSSHSLAPPLPSSAMPAPPAAPPYQHGVHPHPPHHHMYPPMPPVNPHSSMHNMYSNTVGPSTSSNPSSYSAPAPPLPPTPPMPPIAPHSSMHNIYNNTGGPSTSSSYSAPPPPLPPNRWWW